jgi:type II secretory pathway component GspD/PulD (secretin)
MGAKGVCGHAGRVTLPNGISLVLCLTAAFALFSSFAVESSDSLRAAQIVAEKTATEVAEKAVTDAVKAAAEKAAKEQVEAAVKAAVEKAAKDSKAKTDAKADEEKAKTERKEERRAIDTRVFRLAHASPEGVAEQLNKMWSGDFGTTWKITKMAVAFPESNSVLVTAPRQILDACEKAVAELDVEPRQVYIEARFVELGNTASHKVGIDWSMLDGLTSTMTVGGGIQQYNVGTGVTEYKRSTSGKANGLTETETYGISGSKNAGSSAWSTSDGSITYFNGTLTFSQMALTLRALDATEDTKTFSNPKIIVSSGKKATVDMTTKYPNVKVSAKRTTGTTDSLDLAAEMVAIPGEDKFLFAKEAFFSWGISLDVTPRVSTNELINVSIVPTISSQEDWVETGTSDDTSGTVSSKYPVIKVQRLITDFNLASGTTAVIGGLSITDEQQIDNGIPILREIPWIGPRIFGSMQRVKVQKEIIVFVTVGLVDPHQVAPDAGLPKNAVLGRQYTKGQKLEPGDRPEKNMEGVESLDMRTLDEQAHDPLQTQKKSGFRFGDYIPFRKDPEYNK